MNALLNISADDLISAGRSPGLSLIEIKGSEKEAITEVLARLSTAGPFHVIPGGEWLPDQVDMWHAIRMHTTAVDECLDRINLRRADTCLKILDLLEHTDQKPDLLLALDFLHHFYNTDFDLSLRLRVLERCCAYLKTLALTRPVIVFVLYLPGVEYEDFFLQVAGIADEIIRIGEVSPGQPAQLHLFEDQ